MKVINLSKEIENLEKNDFTDKEDKSKNISSKSKDTASLSANKVLKKDTKVAISNNTSTQNIERKTVSNLPAVRKVAIAKRRTTFVLLVALFISCFSLSVFIGFVGPFLLFK